MRAYNQLILAAAFGVACSGGSTSPSDNSLFGGVQPPPGARAEFTVLPVALTGTIEPLGHLAPAGHTIPTDHVYFYGWDAYRGGSSAQDSVARTVYAPATGTVAYKLQPTGTDWKIGFVVTKDFSYYVDHVLLRESGLAVGDVVQAGDVIGTANSPAALDLGAFDTSRPAIAFANPKRYGPQTLYCVNPFEYFVEPLRSQLYAAQYRVATAPRDATINFDIAGRLRGNWYEESVPNTHEASEGPIGWPKSLAFVYDNYDPSLPRISIGGTIIPSVFVGTIPNDAPRFEDVSVASGKMTYSIRYTGSTNVQFGLMIVQMLASDRLRVEVFQDATTSSAEFDSRAHIYVR